MPHPTDEELVEYFRANAQPWLADWIEVRAAIERTELADALRDLWDKGGDAALERSAIARGAQGLEVLKEEIQNEIGAAYDWPELLAELAKRTGTAQAGSAPKPKLEWTHRFGYSEARVGAFVLEVSNAGSASLSGNVTSAKPVAGTAGAVRFAREHLTALLSALPPDEEA